MIFRLIPDIKSIRALVQGIVYVKVKPGNLQQTIASVQKAVETVAGNVPPEYHFLDEEYERLYRSETRMSTIFNYAAILAVLIACIGLLGLSSFLLEQRTKEVGIRKVLGASESALVFRLSKEFIIGVSLANLIAWPIAWYLMNGWLQNFAYRIDLTPWPFLIAALSAVVIALFTVSWQAIRAATANPVESLRYE
jgi:putative ABC transport system permease protein